MHLISEEYSDITDRLIQGLEIVVRYVMIKVAIFPVGGPLPILLAVLHLLFHRAGFRSQWFIASSCFDSLPSNLPAFKLPKCGKLLESDPDGRTLGVCHG